MEEINTLEQLAALVDAMLAKEALLDKVDGPKRYIYDSDYYPRNWQDIVGYAIALGIDATSPGEIFRPTQIAVREDGTLDWETPQKFVRDQFRKRLKWLQKKLPKPKRKWTQQEVDRTLEDYQQEHIADFMRLVNLVGSSRIVAAEAARKAARKLFGRNVMAKAIGNAPTTMVSRSSTYKAISGALDLGKPVGVGGAKIGESVALELKAEELGDTTFSYVDRRETMRRIKHAVAAGTLKKAHADALVDDLSIGNITDDRAMEIMATLAD